MNPTDLPDLSEPKCLKSNRETKIWIPKLLEKTEKQIGILVSKILVLLRFDLENFGLERSGRSVGFISTNSHIYKSSWCRVMTKKPKVNEYKSNEYFNVSVIHRPEAKE